jgi:GT2 family glycosyltransferase
MEPNPLSIVIVTYNSEKFLINCLDNLRADDYAAQAEIIIIDNHSKDRTPSLLNKLASTGIKIILNNRNRGYAAACNQGLQASTSPFVLFMNPDSFPRENTIRSLVEHMQHNHRTGAASVLLLNPDRSIQYSCREYPHPSYAVLRLLERFSPHCRKLLQESYLMSSMDHTRDASVPWVTGAFMLIRKKAFLEINGFDEGFFLYCEDADLCLRLNQKGWKVDFAPSSGDAIHLHQRLSRQRKPSLQNIIYSFIHARSLVRFFSKNAQAIHNRSSHGLSTLYQTT